MYIEKIQTFVTLIFMNKVFVGTIFNKFEFLKTFHKIPTTQEFFYHRNHSWLTSFIPSEMYKGPLCMTKNDKVTHISLITSYIFI